jgi:hypothetical protein
MDKMASLFDVDLVLGPKTTLFSHSMKKSNTIENFVKFLFYLITNVEFMVRLRLFFVTSHPFLWRVF